MIKVLANSLVPIFAALLFGYIAGLRKVVDNKNVKSLATFVMSFALPCSLFASIAQMPHDLLWSQGRISLVFAVIYLSIFALTYFAAHAHGKDTVANNSVLALTLAFPNVAGVSLPLLQTVYGSQAIATVAVALAIGSITVTPVTLAILESSTDQGKTLATNARIRNSAWKAVKKPVFWAPVLGVVAVAINLHVPSYVDRSLAVLGGATAGTALFLTGLVLSAQRFHLHWSVGWSVLVKNLLQPALCLAIAHLASLSLEQTRYVVLIAAAPCGFFGIVFGKSFHATPDVASSSLIASYVVGIFTLAGWVVLLNHLY
jgi:malonate transporter